MTTIEHEIQAKCEPERLWMLLSDLEAVAHYNPTVSAARVRGARRSGVGAERSCDLRPKGTVVERVTHWEEGRAVGLEVAESDWPIHYMRWVTRIAPAAGGSVITQTLEYQVKFGPLGWLLDRLVMKRKLAATLDSVFASLVKHAEGRA
jgi:hypothetical protein